MATASQVLKGGITSKGDITVFHTGGIGANSTTMGTDTTPVVTETYICRLFVEVNGFLTGAALLNGSAVAGNVTAILYDRNGAPMGQSASTAQSGTAAFQAFDFAAPIRVVGPGLHFVGFQFDSTSARFRTHALGRFTAFKKTGETYGTATAITSPNSFTANLGPVASTY